jgi:hypothetical protein
VTISPHNKCKQKLHCAKEKVQICTAKSIEDRIGYKNV